MSATEQDIIDDLKALISSGVSNFDQWIKENPEKASKILKAHCQLFLTEIIEGRIFEYDE